MEPDFKYLADQLEGDLHLDNLTRTIYATDASIYREIPAAVAYPLHEQDIIVLVRFAAGNGISLIPRTAGTSLAGQVTGPGIVVDVSRYMNRILEIQPEKRYARVQPGVVLDELNRNLKNSGLFFGPEASTSNRCMIGGMLGNNACGLHSLVYGSTRDHTISVRAVLSDGSVAEFGDLTPEELAGKMTLNNLEGNIYRELSSILTDPANQESIRSGYPDPEVPRRNTGYALDLLLDSEPFTQSGKPFNLCRLLGGSEGTLVFFSEIKVKLVDLPPVHQALVCAHFHTLKDALNANVVVLEHAPTAVELMDNVVLECTKTNHTQRANRFFVDGDPRAVLIIEFAEHTEAELNRRIHETTEDLKNQGLGYSFPVVSGQNMKKVWELRKAGLGSLANIPGDNKAVTVIEDIAVPVKKQAAYIQEIEDLFARHGKTCVYHAHVGTGELHLRPVLNLKDPDDLILFNKIAQETIPIVKKYGGSLSGEHGDGRLRARMIPFLLGEHNYMLLKRVKMAFDPRKVFNPGKITDGPPMDSSLRNVPGLPTPELPTYFDFSASLGLIRAAEKCNGSGDCRKSAYSKGAMCPSYQATSDEKNTTRARANILQEFLLRKNKGSHFDHREIYEILDQCLSCKACQSECPSNVDMARLKAEFLQHWYDKHGMSLRTRLIAYLPYLYHLASPFAGLANTFLKSRQLSKMFMKVAGFHPDRSMPHLAKNTLSSWYNKQFLTVRSGQLSEKGFVYLFPDEFTDHQDPAPGIAAIKLLTRLGYEVKIAGRTISARTFISKGLIKEASRIIRENILLYDSLLSAEHPLIGIEPSAILGFRDEFPDLAGPDLKEKATRLIPHTFLLEEFLEREMRAGRITKESFKKESKEIILHGHCHQKSLASIAPTLFVLNFPENYRCVEIPSGCCGMAGSFGFEKEHFELSMKVGELVLFPIIRVAEPGTVICATGTSCRHQILDGTGKISQHPAEILFEALAAS